MFLSLFPVLVGCICAKSNGRNVSLNQCSMLIRLNYDKGKGRILAIALLT